MRILLVDDSVDSRSIIADWLNEFFATVFIESAASGGQALEAIARRCPELVLATHQVPAVSAIELVRVIKARPNPPVAVVINAGSDAELERECAAAGADFCVEKRHLQARLLAFLQQRFSGAWAEGVAARRISACSDSRREHRANGVQRRVVERRHRIAVA
jgi:CheY-like chemotaxis protein